MLTQKIIEKEFALSGSEQNPDLTGKSVRQVLGRVRSGAPAPVEAFKQHGADFVVEDTLEDLVRGMNALTDEPLLDVAELGRQIEARDRELDNAFTKDQQITALRGARNYRGDKLIRVASPHRILDPKAGPLIAVKLHILTRKTLGGLETDLEGRVLTGNGQPLLGLYAAGEVSRVRRWRDARLSLPGRDVPGGLHLLRPTSGPGSSGRYRLIPAPRRRLPGISH